MYFIDFGKIFLLEDITHKKKKSLTIFLKKSFENEFLGKKRNFDGWI